MVQTRIAFDNLLEVYEGTKVHWYHSILEIGKKQGNKYKDFVKNAFLKNAITTWCGSRKFPKRQMN